MKPESIAFAVAGVVFGLIAGYVMGYQKGTLDTPAASVGQARAPQPAAAAPAAAVLDEAKVTAYRSVADREPSNAAPRVQLGNLYFDAERYDDAIRWYSDALKLDAKDVDVSTDLGVSYYYVNQPDKALAQFDQSLKIDPKHAKTILNVGIVKAFGKQDLPGAQQAWEQVIKLAPNTPEGQAAQRALESLRSAHPPGAPSRPGA
jgi:tetratricopeptide (TPR) repeat protein